MNRILAAVSDMIFAAKISGTAQHLSLAVTFARSQEQLISAAINEAPSLILLDLNNPRFDPLAAIEALKQDAKLREIPIVGFLSHVQTDLWRRAEALGCDRVLPRSKFTAQLGEILSGNLTNLN